MKGLKVVLWICAVSCLVCFIFAALPWRAISAWFHWAGVEPPSAEPINVYMIRLFLAIGGMIGIFFAILAQNPLKYGAMLLLAGYGLLCYGLFCLVGGIRYAFPVRVYAVDVFFGIVAGLLILILRKKAMSANSA